VKQTFRIGLAMALLLTVGAACDSKNDPVASGREAVKEVVNQPFNTFEDAKASLQQSEEKSKAALQELEKETNP
jgi:hypothetical protein